MTGSTSYYKITASLSYMNEEWGADYPYDGPAAASGRWVLIQGKYYSDDDREVNWNNLWNFAARGYAAANARYTLRVMCGLHHYWRQGDIVEMIYQDPQGRVDFVSGDPPENYFEVEQVTYELNTEQGHWKTVYVLRELTTYTAPTPSIPAVPTGN